MASIFKNSKIRENLEHFEVPDLEKKIELVQEWYDYYHKGTLKQEKEITVAPRYSQFLIDLLGYKGKPADGFTLESEPTTEDKGGQRPDLLLGHLSGEDRNISAVVELKGANIPLDRPQRREGNMSPIQQAFKYKPQFNNCSFVIASNFYEIRLFQDTQLDYEIWTLDDLLNPEDNYFQFRKFYYLLCAQNFVAKSGKSKTEELLSDIRVDAEKISKKFYKEYHELRTDLLRSMYKNNQIIRDNIDFGIEKAQKIVDRVVFVCFCEDTGLLPEHTLKRVLDNSKDNFGSLWSSLQGFFEAIDKGDEKLELPDGYNGGLFSPDTELRNLEVDDKILSKLLDLGKYDFSEDLTVNILGHIFEQSISDLEEIKQKVEKDKKINSKRKKDGIFYTPDYIVDYIVKNSLGKYLEEKEEELKNKYKLKGDITDKTYEKREREAYEEYQDFLQKVKVLDPACGSGAFLVKVFDYLLAENQRVGAILGNLFGIDSYNKHILKNNIYGVDLNQESVEITKLSLWLKTAQKNKKLTVLDDNIKCGNSLIDDPEVAGDKAFDWNKEFKEIMVDGGFDVIVGNPPYVDYSKIQGVDFLNKKYVTAVFEGKILKYNLFQLFIENAANLLKENGQLGFINPNTFLSADNAISLRKFLLKNVMIKEIIDVSNINVFKEASTYPVIHFFTKQKKMNTNKVKVFIVKNEDDLQGLKFNLIKQESFLVNENYNFILESNIIILNLLKKMDAFMKLEEYSDVFCWGSSITGFAKHKSNENKEGFSRLIQTRDIKRYSINWTGDYIENNIYSDRLKEIFNQKKIVIARMTLKLQAYLDDQKYFVGKSAIYIPKNYEMFEYLLIILNSKLLNFYYKTKFSTTHLSGGYIRFDIPYLSRLPIPELEKGEEGQYIKIVKIILDLNKKMQNKLDKFSSRLQSNFNLEKLSKKLEKFYELDWAEFLQELKKKKVELSLKDQDEWEDYFNDYKKEILALKSQIDKTDKEIDQMVYDLYGLDEKEIAVVEGE